eukprot:6188221-Pleurochrysis_carterae.AAC.2
MEDLLSSYSKEQIRDRIKTVYGDPISYMGLIRLVVMDLQPSLDDGVLADFLKYSKTTAKDEASLKANQKREEDDTDYHAQYNALMNLKLSGRNMEDLLLLLYTKGMYDNKGEISMIARSYFHSVYVINTASDYTDKTRNYYIVNEG